MRILLLFILILLAPIHHALSIEVPFGETAPDFTLNNIKGEDVSLKDFKGENIALIYWKVDHNYSYKAIEDYGNIFKIYNKKGVKFIGISGETGDHEKVSKTVKDLKIKFPVLLDPNRTFLGSYGIRVYPTTLLIDRKGKLIHAIPGHPVLYNSILDGYLRYILGEINEEELKAVISPQKTEVDESEIMAEREYNLSLKFGEIGLTIRAIKTVKTAIKYKPDMIKARNLLGFLYLQSKEPDKAISEFQKALDIDPNSFDAMAGTGMACLSQGEIDYAIKVLTEAAKLNKKSSVIYYELGKAYELKDDKDTALSMYKKSLQIAEDQMFFYQVNSQCR
jgi:tetratricopeptide (TPR) repeat protein